MDKLLIQNARVYQNGKFVRADVLCGDALIAKIGENLTDGEARVIQADGLRLVPGFIDVHTHGAAGVDVNAADGTTLALCDLYTAGVTGTPYTCWLPTVNMKRCNATSANPARRAKPDKLFP